MVGNTVPVVLGIVIAIQAGQALSTGSGEATIPLIRMPGQASLDSQSADAVAIRLKQLLKLGSLPKVTPAGDRHGSSTPTLAAQHVPAPALAPPQVTNSARKNDQQQSPMLQPLRSQQAQSLSSQPGIVGFAPAARHADAAQSIMMPPLPRLRVGVHHALTASSARAPHPRNWEQSNGGVDGASEVANGTSTVYVAPPASHESVNCWPYDCRFYDDSSGLTKGWSWERNRFVVFFVGGCAGMVLLSLLIWLGMECCGKSATGPPVSTLLYGGASRYALLMSPDFSMQAPQGGLQVNYELTLRHLIARRLNRAHNGTKEPRRTLLTFIILVFLATVPFFVFLYALDRDNCPPTPPFRCVSGLGTRLLLRTHDQPQHRTREQPHFHHFAICFCALGIFHGHQGCTLGAVLADPWGRSSHFRRRPSTGILGRIS